MPMDASDRREWGKLARRVVEVEKQIRRSTRTRQAGFRSLDGASQKVFDVDGIVRQVVGVQDDGTYTTVDVNAPAPTVPSLPVAEAHPGVVVVRWDGLTGDGSGWPKDFARVEVHATSNEDLIGDTSDETQVHTFTSIMGGEVTLTMPAGVEVFVWLVAVNTSGVESEPTVDVSATPTAVSDPFEVTAEILAAKLAAEAVAAADATVKAAAAEAAAAVDATVKAAAAVATASSDATTKAVAAQLAAEATAASDATTKANAAQSAATGAAATDATTKANAAQAAAIASASGDATTKASAAQAAAIAAAASDATTKANAAEAAATAVANTKVKTFAQTSAPSALAAGDLWVDTDDANKLYRATAAGSGSWVAVRDTTIAAAQSTADAKTKTFRQTSIPTSVTIGDDWYDTDDENKHYVAAAAGATTIAAGQWELLPTRILSTADSGERIVIRNDGSGGVIESYSGVSGETPGVFDPSAFVGRPNILIQSGTSPAFPDYATLFLASDAAASGRATLAATEVRLLAGVGAGAIRLVGIGIGAGFDTWQVPCSSNATATSTTNVTIAGFSQAVTSPGAAAVYMVEIDAQLATAAGTAAIIELLVDGVAQTAQIIQSTSALETHRVHGKWRITGLSAGSHTFTARLRNSAAATSSVVTAGNSLMTIERKA